MASNYLSILLASALGASATFSLPSPEANSPKQLNLVSTASQESLDNTVKKMYSQGGFIKTPDFSSIKFDDGTEVPIYLKGGQMIFPMDGMFTRIASCSPRFFKKNKKNWVEGMASYLSDKIQDPVSKRIIRGKLVGSLYSVHQVLLGRLEGKGWQGSTNVKQLDFPRYGTSIYELPNGFRFGVSR